MKCYKKTWYDWLFFQFKSVFLRMGGLFISRPCCLWLAGKQVHHKLFVPHDALLRTSAVVTSHRDGRVVHSNLNKLFNTLLLKMIFILIKVSYIMFLLPD